jgi:hypothetical protein
MTRTHLGRSRVRENRMLGSVGAKLNGLATRPTPEQVQGHTNYYWSREEVLHKLDTRMSAGIPRSPGACKHRRSVASRCRAPYRNRSGGTRVPHERVGLT